MSKEFTWSLKKRVEAEFEKELCGLGVVDQFVVKRVYSSLDNLPVNDPPRRVLVYSMQATTISRGLP
jgi:hypothetical protein